MMHWLQQVDWLQWLSMAVTVGAAWLTASSQESRRHWGFWVFLSSNVLWGWWAVQHSAWALLTLQISLALMNMRGAKKNDADAED